MISNKQKALIHIARQETDTSEEEYRQMLAEYGVASSTQLSGRQFDHIMRRFKAGGFVPRLTQNTNERQPLCGKIKALLHACDLSEAYADGIARKMFGIHQYRWCHPEQLGKIVAALEYHKKRTRKKNRRDIS